MMCIPQGFSFFHVSTVGCDDRSSRAGTPQARSAAKRCSSREKTPEAELESELGLGGHMDEVVRENAATDRRVPAPEAPTCRAASFPPAVRPSVL